MPYKDPEIRRVKAREYTRKHRERNREAYNSRQRELRAQDPGPSRRYGQKYREQNREKLRAKNRERKRRDYEENHEKILQRRRDYVERNRELVNERQRLNYKAEQMFVWRMFRKHGLRPEEWTALWDAQDGLCYLCGEPLPVGEAAVGRGPAGKAVIDHDHSCCPPDQSCRRCRRGLAHPNCNAAIGMANDDPARLRHMADALERAQAAIRERLAGKPTQLELGA